MESKEIIEDQLVSIISKDYLDVFSKYLHGSSVVRDLYFLAEWTRDQLRG